MRGVRPPPGHSSLGSGAARPRSTRGLRAGGWLVPRKTAHGQTGLVVNSLHAHKRSQTNPQAQGLEPSGYIQTWGAAPQLPLLWSPECQIHRGDQKQHFGAEMPFFWVCPHPAVGSLRVAEGRGGEEISWSLLFPAGPAATSPDSLFTSGRRGAWLGSSSAASDQNTRKLRAAAGFEDRNDSARQAQVGRGR